MYSATYADNLWPNARELSTDMGLATSPTTPLETLKWTMENKGWRDLDTGYKYMEITSTLHSAARVIKTTDVITFHVEFTSASDTSRAKMCRDGFEAQVSKSLTSDYWDVTVKDLYARATTGEDCADAAAADIVTAEDFNNAVENDGQDWFVFE